MNKIRLAHLEDTDEITKLIETSARVLGGEFYDKKTIEKALKGAFGVDTQLIKDKTYYLISQDNKLVACGGWSFRETLFGSDAIENRSPRKLDVKTESAKIRAFFIHPKYARQGLGKIILEQCETEAIKQGFTSIQLMSTLSGVKFYEKNGYIGKNHIFHKMDNKSPIKFLPMQKDL